jgi:hypothetical protein
VNLLAGLWRQLVLGKDINVGPLAKNLHEEHHKKETLMSHKSRILGTTKVHWLGMSNGDGASIELPLRSTQRTHTYSFPVPWNSRVKLSEKSEQPYKAATWWDPCKIKTRISSSYPSLMTLSEDYNGLVSVWFWSYRAELFLISV